MAGNGRAGFSGDGAPATQAMLNGPSDVAADQAGNLYLIDLNNLRIRQVTLDGKINTVAGLGYGGALNIEGQLATKTAMDYSWGLTVDAAGNLYVASGVYIYRINAAGVLTILVGGGLEGYQEGFDGDGGPAVAAHIRGENFPGLPHTGMGVGPDGSLYVADTGNDRIRRITNPGAAAQLVVENLDFPVPSFPYPGTGADQIDFNLFPVPERLMVTNAGSGPMSWTATTSTVGNIDWLRISSSSESAPSTITVSADTAKLSSGFYWGTMLISAPKASDSPRYVSGYAIIPIPLLSPGSSTGTFTVAEPPGVGWFASSNVDWITITSPASGNGIGSFSYSAAAYPGSTQRSGVLTVGGSPPITVTQAAQGPFIQAIVDSWDYTPGIAPGAWVTITGSALASGAPQTWNLNGTQQLPTMLSGTTVTFNGTQAALYYVSPTQINALVPASVAPGPVQVVVQANGVSSNPFPVTATATLPSIYALPNSDGSAFFVTAALAGTGTLIGNSAVDPRVTRAALPGDVLDLYMAGLGATVDPTEFITNQVFAGAYPVSAAVTASVGGKPAQVLFAGLTSPGLYLVRVAIPLDVPPGPQPIQVATGGGKTPSSLMLMVGTPD
ncbi:hypothetical protein SBA3_1180005 [Candidatus Sulfopaludibacter sp. SbA3]|nr:hypothetical protein SBA3_1180005 [Candidatus Sulfopaludibacter sp. SbA3]